MAPGGSLVEGNATPTYDGTDVFDDAFAVDDFDVVADGFRPGGHDDHIEQGHENGRAVEALERQEWNMPEHSGHRHSRSISDQFAPGTVVPPIISTWPSRNSTRKSNSAENPFRNAQEEDDSPLEVTPSGNFAPATTHRFSTASSSQFARTNSQRFGASGPSHPYGMYPQDTMARSPSVATTSSIRPPEQPALGTGPQHPYALYPQGVDEGLQDDSSPENLVPVGFTGLSQNFRRRRGPDGEEQDIIGDDGHAEQLPPYTRYPQDGPEKLPPVTAPGALHSRAPVMGTDPGMELMHTHIRPRSPQQSMTDESTLQRQPLMASDGASISRSINLEKDWNEKSWKEKTWGERRKTRYCGIPLWCYVLALAIFCFIGAVLGGVLGGFAEGRKSSNDTVVKFVSTTLLDASIIPTPATATLPPSGTFMLSMSTPQATQAACLSSNPQQEPAWSCHLTDAGDLSIVVSTNSQNTSETGASIVYTPYDGTGGLSYGEQTSQMSTNFTPFLMVTDNDDPSAGPAFYIEQKVNKWVIVPEHALQPPASRSKRHWPPSPWLMNERVTNPGDKPWFCFWNNTLLEVFIYIQKPVNIKPSKSPSSTSAGSTTTENNWHGHSRPSYVEPTVAPTEPYSTAVAFPNCTSTFNGAASMYSAWFASQMAAWPTITPSSDGLRPRRRETKEYLVEDVVEGEGFYPFLIKIEERRLPNSQPPYCMQYQILDSGGYNYAPNPDGSDEPVQFQLTENDPDYGVYQSLGIAGNKPRGTDTVPGGCSCAWMSGLDNTAPG